MNFSVPFLGEPLWLAPILGKLWRTKGAKKKKKKKKERRLRERHWQMENKEKKKKVPSLRGTA